MKNARLWLAIAAQGALTFAAAQGTGINVFRPDRGFRPTGSYSVADTESVNETNGNVSIRIPLAATPPARNGANFQLAISYNSALFNLATQDLDPDKYILSGYSGEPGVSVTVNALVPSDLTATGGWRYSHHYYLEEDVRPCSPDHPYCIKWNLILPDGSSHLLRLNATGNDPDGTGFSQFAITGRHWLTADYIGPNLVYHTTDGSFIRVEATTDSQQNYDGSWRASFPNGDYVSGPIIGGFPKEADQVCDRNNACTTIVNNLDPYPNLTSTEMIDAVGRKAVISYDVEPGVDDIKALGYGADVAQSSDPRTNPTSLTTRVVWKHISFGEYADSTASPWRGIMYACRTPLGDEYVCTNVYSLWVVDRITLPHPSGQLSYDFTYADNTAPVDERAQGEIREMLLPSAKPGEIGRASVHYSWSRIQQTIPASPTPWADAMENPVQAKVLTYIEESDGTPVQATRTWQYQIGSAHSEITAPDGGVTTHDYGNRSLVGSWEKGLVHKTVSPHQGTTWRCWRQNEPWLGVYATDDPRNPFVATEYRKMPDSSSRIAATQFDYDKNGNLLSKDEYGWVASPGEYPNLNCTPSGTILRSTDNTYWNPAGGAGSPAHALTPPTSDLVNAYWNPGTNRTRNSLLEARVSSAATGVAAVTQFEYDDPDTTANATRELRWDDELPGAGSPPTAPSTGVTLGISNAAITTRSYSSGTTPGLLLTETDPNGNVTAFTYEQVLQAPGGSACPATYTNLYPDSVTVASGRPEAQVRRYYYDCASGLVKHIVNESNSNVRTSLSYDIFGRLTEQVEASEQSDNAKKRKTTTEYDDLNRTVRTSRDVSTYNDGLLATAYHFNQLGELYLTRETDDTGGPVSAGGSDGIKMATVERVVSGDARYRLTSNPFRSSADVTMGWTVETFDRLGRLTHTGFYRGSGRPAPFGSNTQLTGQEQRSYAGDTTTITDANSSRTIVADPLGRIASVSEGSLSGASYAYDAFDNISTVTQTDTVTYASVPPNAGPKTQTRQFGYSSLGRLVSAVNPESGSTAYEYYRSGALKKRTDARGAWVQHTIDGLDRVTRKTYGGAASAPEAGYCYDGQAYSAAAGTCSAVTRSDYPGGMLTGFYTRKGDGSLIASTGFSEIDPLGRVLQSTHKVGPLDSQTIEYRYNAADALSAVKYPSGNWVSYDVTGANRVSLVRKGQTGTTYYLSGAAYAPHGALASATVGSSAFTETREYNSRLQARRVLAAKGASALLGLRWVYSGTYNASTFEETGSDNTGNVRYERIETPARNTLRSYGYDAANRLTSFAEDTGKSQNFGYDGFGNLWQTSASGVPELIPNGPTWYVQQAPELQGQVTNRFNAVAYTAAGQQENLSVFGGPWTIRYDAEGRMERIERTDVTPALVLGEYEYDAEGRRVKRVADGTATYYIYDASGSLLAEYGGTAAVGGTRFVVSDHLGSTRLVLDEAGGCRSRMDYAPFGAEIPRTDDCYTSSAEVAQKFTGQELDAESALYYFGARQYAWEQGRFVSPDAPLTYSDPQNPRSWNLYSYAFNSPLLYSDPDGHDPCVNGINPITGNICTIVTAPMPDDQTDDEPDTSFFWDVYLRSLAISAVVVYQAQPLVDWLGRPRDPVCTGTYTGVGASIGFWAGGGLGTLGLAGGPTAAATIPGGAAGGAMFGGGIGGVAGLVMCSSGRWGGSGAGRGGGDHRDKTRGAQAKEQKNLNEIARKLNIDRHAFGDYVEQVKRAVGRGSSSEYGYRELVKLARQYIAEGGK